MAKKEVFDYSLRVDKTGNMRFSNETGELDKPENCMSYMLVGILGCMALTARPILEKMRIECDAVIAKGKLYMVDEAVRYGNRIECTLGLENGPELDAETKARIAELTKKHCSVSVTIAKNPEITLAME